VLELCQEGSQKVQLSQMLKKEKKEKKEKKKNGRRKEKLRVRLDDSKASSSDSD
jgi:hypothetical protein